MSLHTFVIFSNVCFFTILATILHKKVVTSMLQFWQRSELCLLLVYFILIWLIHTSCSKSITSYVLILAHNLREECWLYINWGWTSRPIIFFFCLVNLAKWQMTWEYIKSRSVLVNSFMKSNRIYWELSSFLAEDLQRLTSDCVVSIWKVESARILNSRLVYHVPFFTNVLRKGMKPSLLPLAMV